MDCYSCTKTRSSCIAVIAFINIACITNLELETKILSMWIALIAVMSVALWRVEYF